MRAVPRLQTGQRPSTRLEAQDRDTTSASRLCWFVPVVAYRQRYQEDLAPPEGANSTQSSECHSSYCSGPPVAAWFRSNVGDAAWIGRIQKVRFSSGLW